MAGPDEIEKGIVTLRRLRDGKEFTVPMSEASEKVTDLLNNE